jgi:hypothetical protein
MTLEEEEREWSRVLERWDEDEVHRTWLANFTDVDGLARAGKRYREALVADPGDPVAARWRDEVVKRATVQGLASLPRTPGVGGRPRWITVTLIVALSALVAAGLWWSTTQLVAIVRAR